MYCTPKEENAGDILLKKKQKQKNFIVIIFYDRFINITSFAWKLKKRPEITFILQCHFCQRTQLKKSTNHNSEINSHLKKIPFVLVVAHDQTKKQFLKSYKVVIFE